MNKAYNKEFDAVLLTYSVLKRLGCGGVDTFQERLKSQKVQYIAQVFGISPSYKFNLYLRGPYSPELASDLFHLKADKIKVSAEKFTPEELEDRFVAAQSFVKGKSIRQLELVATLHWLNKVANYPLTAALSKLKELKNADTGELKEAASFLKAL